MGFYLEYLSYVFLLLVLVFEFGFTTHEKLISMSSLLLMLVYQRWFSNEGLREFYVILIPLAVSLYAIYRKKQNAFIIFVSLVILTLFTYLDDYNTIEDLEFVTQNLIVKSIVFYFDAIGFMSFAFVMIYLSAKNILSQQKLLNETQLKSARLENELVQKHISPHFIMNSLMSLQELIDVDKHKASEMIDSLSEEFHLLATMSKEKLILLSEELEICRVHLKIMGLQQRARFTLDVEGVDGTEMIPPAVIHTLVENGMTHGYSGKEDGYFKLTKTYIKPFTTFTLFNNSKVKEKPKSNSSKTGLNYVRARLEESYPGCWRLESGRVEGGWEVSVKIEGLQ